MKSVEILPLKSLGPDNRGKTYEFTINPTKGFLFLIRKKGTVSGNTYQKGGNSATNPKTFILLNGSIILHIKPVDSDKIKQLSISEPSIIKIAPYITHAIEAKTDIQLLEAASLVEIVEDRIKDHIV